MANQNKPGYGMTTKTSQQVLSWELLPKKADYLAPDGSEVRHLVTGTRGNMAHFRLSPGHTSQAVAHRTVEEIWYILKGSGEMWRKPGSSSKGKVVKIYAGVSINIPIGTHFQFRSLGKEALEAVAVTMPPWPGANEAPKVQNYW